MVKLIIYEKIHKGIISGEQPWVKPCKNPKNKNACFYFLIFEVHEAEG